MKNYVLNYFGNSALCHNIEQAVDFINQLTYEGKAGRITCNDYCRRKIEELFTSDSEITYLITSGCRQTRIYVYPALASTLEEHNKIYKEELARKKEIRMRENAERLRKLEEKLNETRPGIYEISLDCAVTENWHCSNIYKTLNYTIQADSAMSAYKKAATKAIEWLDNCSNIINYEIPRPTSSDFQYILVAKRDKSC